MSIVYSIKHKNTINEDMFFEELSQCDDDEQLACEVSDEMYETIKEKFGIKSL